MAQINNIKKFRQRFVKDYNLPINIFDDNLFEMFTKKYNASDNSTKRDISSALLGLTFDHPEYSSEENIHNTKERFERLIRYLGAFDDTDSIAKLINKSVIEKISDKFELSQNT